MTEPIAVDPRKALRLWSEDSDLDAMPDDVFDKVEALVRSAVVVLCAAMGHKPTRHEKGSVYCIWCEADIAEAPK